MDTFTELILEICTDEGIDCRLFSHGWIYRLEKNGRVRHIIGRHFDLNPAAADRIACDKYACATLLDAGGIPVIPHEMLFNPLIRTNWIGEEGEWDRALRFFNDHGRRVVVKSNTGWQGRDVYLCDSAKAMERASHIIFQNEPNVCLCPFYEIEHEYRVFYVNGECPFVYGKERAFVTGDGQTSLAALAELLDINSDSLRFPCEVSFVPPKGERVCVSWKHNLSNGASAFEVDDPVLLSELTTLSKRAAQCINIVFATVDIARLPSGKLTIMEINAGVTATKLLEQHPHRRDKVKSIYAGALRAMFT